MALSADEFKRQLDESRVVKEVFEEITGWIPQLQTMLADPDNAYESRDYEQFRGSLKAIRNMLNAPSVIFERKQLDEKGEIEDDDA